MKNAGVIIAVLIVIVIFVAVVVYKQALSPPEVPTDLKNVIITLERTGCYGTCPIYKLQVYGNSTVVYEGIGFVKTKGVQTTEISEEKIRQLVSEFYRINYFSLKDTYTNRMATDMPSAITSITVMGRTKKITHYYGDFSAPKELINLESKIDEVVGSKRWIYYVTARLDAPFQLKISESALINDDGSEIKINFLNVTSDSRCPRDVQCVWAGQVTILSSVSISNVNTGEFSLSPAGYGTPSSASFGGYSLTLLEVQPPYPAVSREYSANFTLSKSNASTVYLGEGQRNGPLLVQKIYPDRVEGLAFREYPIAVDKGTPVTLLIGESASNGCDVALTLVKINGNVAEFSKKIEPNKPCPICLSGNTYIDTPNGSINVKNLHEGMAIWTSDKSGSRQYSIILKTSKVAVPANHKMVHIVLTDGRELFASPGHPLADGRLLGSIAIGDIVDGSEVTTAEEVPYGEGYTYDILPSGETGTYWANGILVRSTLVNR